jgi:hypothetical protein
MRLVFSQNLRLIQRRADSEFGVVQTGEVFFELFLALF